MADSITRTVEIAAPVEQVWQAIGDAEKFGAWFRIVLDGPFHEGEEATGRILYPGFEHVVWRARIVAIEPPRRLGERQFLGRGHESQHFGEGRAIG